jgi:hypothetical protein
MAACSEELQDWPAALQACSQAIDLYELHPESPQTIQLLRLLHSQRQFYAQQAHDQPLAEAEAPLIDLLERLWSAPQNASLWRQLGTLLQEATELRLRQPHHARAALARAMELEGG